MARHSAETLQRIDGGGYRTFVQIGASGIPRHYNVMRTEAAAAYSVFAETIERLDRDMHRTQRIFPQGGSW